jgi:hypothetical protein
LLKSFMFNEKVLRHLLGWPLGVKIARQSSGKEGCCEMRLVGLFPPGTHPDDVCSV